MMPDPELTPAEEAELAELEQDERAMLRALEEENLPEFTEAELSRELYAHGYVTEEAVARKRNRPSRTPKERAQYRLGQIREQAQRLSGYGLDADVQAVLDLVDAMEAAVAELPADFKPSRGASSRILRVGQIYEVRPEHRDRYARLAGEEADFGILVGEVDDQTVRLQVGDRSIVPVKRAHLGKVVE